MVREAEEIRGVFVDGRVELEANGLANGTEVSVRPVDNGEDAEGFYLSAEDQSELRDRIAEVERGDFVDGDELLERLESRG